MKDKSLTNNAVLKNQPKGAQT